MNNYNIVYSDSLYHHGILGQKWGVRRYQNPDGTLTAEGRQRLQKKEFETAIKFQKKIKKYRDSWSRSVDHYENSKIIQERSKELTTLAEQAKDKDIEVDDYLETSGIYDKAYDKAVKEVIKDHPELMENPEYDTQEFIEICLYDEGYLQKYVKSIGKSDQKYVALEKERDKAIDDYKSKCKDITNDIVGEFGNTKIEGLGTDMTYKELVQYALTNPHNMFMFTWQEKMGRE